MALHEAMAALVEKVAVLEQALDDVVWAVEQGQPPQGGGHALADRYENDAGDLRDLGRQAREAAVLGWEALAAARGIPPKTPGRPRGRRRCAARTRCTRRRNSSIPNLRASRP